MSLVEYSLFVNLPASYYDCIFTGLQAARDHSRQVGLKTAIVTFNLPLFLKAVDIVSSLSMDDIVVRLGGFHLLLSFLDCAGHFMSGSGLK